MVGITARADCLGPNVLNGRSVATGHADTNVLVWDLAPTTRQKLSLDAKELDRLWADLAGDDAAKAYQSAGTLISAPPQTLRFLHQHLQPASVDDQRIARLIADLDSEEFAVREAARKALQDLGGLAEPALRKALEGNLSLETRKKDLDAQLKAAKQRLDELEDVIIPQFIEEGVPSMTVEVDGVKRTLSIYPDVYASPLNDREEVVNALKQSELGQYVAENYNSNSLTGFVREVWKEIRQTANREQRVVTEDDLRSTFYELEHERVARVASVENEADVAAVERLVDTLRKIADEVHRRRDPAVRVAADTAAVPTLPPDTRPKRRKRPSVAWKGLHPFVH